MFSCQLNDDWRVRTLTTTPTTAEAGKKGNESNLHEIGFNIVVFCCRKRCVVGVNLIFFFLHIQTVVEFQFEFEYLTSNA